MKKLSLLFLSILLCAGYMIFPSKAKTKPLVGLIVPMEHTALTQIVESFKKELEDQDIHCKILNAGGDPNIQKGLIQQLLQEDCDLFIPIGTSTSQMTLSLAKDRKIICLSANKSIIPKGKNIKATVLDDTFSVNDSLHFLHTLFPSVKKISLIYSSSEKIAEEVLSAEEACNLYQIKLQKLMVHNLSELYTISQNISTDSQALFILKDNLIASGIASLAKIAEKKNIFVMTSDEGSISSGGAFAIGIKESSMGIQGAKIARSVLQGLSPEMIAPHTLEGPLLLFINEESCIKQGIDVPSFINKVKQMGLQIEHKERS